MMKHTCAASVPYAGAVGPADKKCLWQAGTAVLASRVLHTAREPLTTPAQHGHRPRNDARRVLLAALSWRLATAACAH